MKKAVSITVANLTRLTSNFQARRLTTEIITSKDKMGEPLRIPSHREPKRYFINTLKDYASGHEELTDPQGLKLKIFEMVTNVSEHKLPSMKDCDGGLYVGTAGVGYMFYHVSQSPIFAKEKEEFIKKGINYMNVALEYAKCHKNETKLKAGFLLGNAGVYAVSAALYKAAGMKGVADGCIGEYIAAADVCKPENFLKCGGDELFVGRAGYLAGALWLNKLFGQGTIPDQDLLAVCGSIVSSGRNYARRHHSPCPLMFAYYETEYLGAAHGLCAVLQMLLSCPAFLQTDARATADVRTTVDYLLSLQTDAGNFPCAMDELGPHARPSENELVHWCHGAPGVVYLMAKAYLVWREEKYLVSCLKCGDLVWERGLLKKGPGICHGVAGNGYVFLLLYRLTGDRRHLHRAHRFASFLFDPEFRRKSRTPDSPHSLYEGLAGTACYLADVITPETAAFPFQDVF